MHRISLFNVCLQILGITGRFAVAIRIVMLLLNLTYIIFTSSYIFLRCQCFAHAFRISYYAYGAVHGTMLFIWSWKNLGPIEAKDAPGVVIGSNLLCSVQLVICSGACYSLIPVLESGIWFHKDASLAWKLFVYFNETVGIAVNRLQISIVYQGIAIALLSYARRVDRAISTLEPNEADLKCREVMVLCTTLDRKFSNILKLMFFEYAVRLMTEIPMGIYEVSCGLESFNVLNVLDRLLALLSVIAAGERFYQSAFRLRKRVRTISTERQIQLLPFLKVVHGVPITSSMVVNWKSFCAFLGLTSGFSFMVFQLTVSDSHPCLTYGASYC